jgi:hypothetical protein
MWLCCFNVASLTPSILPQKMNAWIRRITNFARPRYPVVSRTQS